MSARKRLEPPERSDEDLIQAVAAGERTAFDLLVQRHKVRLYNYLLRLLRDPTEAEEIAQETFVRAYVHAGKYRTVARFSTWLYTIATNLVRNRIRKQRSTPKLLSISWGRAEEEEGERSDIDLPDSRDLPDRKLEKREIQDLVAQAIACIPQRYREAFVLREVNHLTYEEIAAITGLKLGTVRSRINRGRGHFRDIMQPMLQRVLGEP
ncbi:MAG TPA: sigma-70 family RNA polymerase sigma factor [Candidatus Krumholzibacteria bacterium]|nr:sigma-70 family RNA polymerase sigma factor [Candidatus Krumholzibacteria bacterium]